MREKTAEERQLRVTPGSNWRRKVFTLELKKEKIEEILRVRKEDFKRVCMWRMAIVANTNIKKNNGFIR